MLMFNLAEGDWWTDDYNVRPVGVLSPPEVIVSTPPQSIWNQVPSSSEKALAADAAKGDNRKSSESWVMIGEEL